jgi:CRISPR-associated endonuclease Csn1
MTKVNIGLDIGTGNTGYAVTDSEYKVISVKGKKALGVLSYDDANTAEQRRTFRTARRRLERRRLRITLLQEIFNDEIMQKDSNFLRRLSENDLHLEDRGVDGKYSLFNEKKYNDVKYYRQYPTIYHLRKALIEEGTDDIRLLYLGLHHIVKYRGHFLINGEIKECRDSTQYFQELNKYLDSRNASFDDTDNEDAKINIIHSLSMERLNDLFDLISGKGEITAELSREIQEKYVKSGKEFYKIRISKKDKKQKAYELLVAKTPAQRNIVNAMFGDKVNITTMFGSDMYRKDDVKGFYLSDELESCEDLNLIKDNPYDYGIINSLKQLYDWYILTDLLKGEENLSQAMINIYNTHKEDLKTLKSLINTYAPTEYDNVFGAKAGKDHTNYTSYIGGGRIGKDKIGTNGRLGVTVPYDVFRKYLKSVLEKIKNTEAVPIVAEIMEKLDNNEFLPKIVSKNNSAIPYQLNELELKKILEKAIAGGNFKFLEQQTDGLKNYEKIIKLLRFRIPYFVGPVKSYKDDTKRSKNAWAIRNGDGRITPWTFDALIDTEKSNEQFIKRMTNKCTYLKNANTLPKNSILFSKFVALSELNKLKINGEAIDVKLKQEIFDNVYMNRKPTIKNIIQYIKDTSLFGEDIKITGYDTEIKGNMNSYIAYERELGEKVDKYPEMVEKIIFLSTMHVDSKMIESSIRKEFGKYLTEDEIKRIKGFKYSGWGNLSKEFLEDGLGLMDNQGEYKNIIDIMYETNQNHQQIISNRMYNFEEALAKYNKLHNISLSNKITIEDVENMYCSPSVKRCVWQTFGLVKDILKQTKEVPQKVFIEVTRTNSDKLKNKKSQTRREKIQKVYEEARKIVAEYSNDDNRIITSLSLCTEELQKKSDSQLNSEKLYLYFMQLGKCMYSGRSIDIDDLFNGNNYDVDHIIPRANVKDDSLDNKVLVDQRINKDKTNIYPIPKEFRQEALWKTLYNAKLISDEKYSRLIRTSKITIEEQDKFINRQLVETSQIAICLKELLEHYFKINYTEPVEIVLSSARNVSTFRKNYGLTKSRDVNDFHHAFDAYYNVVVGDILNKEYNHNWKRIYSEKSGDMVYNNDDKSDNFENTINRAMSIDSGRLLKLVIAETATNNVQITKKIETKKGELFGATIFKADSSDKSKLYPRNSSKIIDEKETKPKSNVAKYGGYKSSGTAYFIVVDSKDKKGNSIRSIESISIYDDKMIMLNKKTYQEVFKEKNLIEAKIANISLPKSALKVGSLLDFGNYKLRLAGITGNSLVLHNANQLIVDNSINDYIKEISIVIEKANKKCRFISNKSEKEIALNEFVEEYNDQNKQRIVKENQSSKIILLSNEKNSQMYDLFVDKLSKHPYKDIPTYYKLKAVLTKSRNNFLTMNLYVQVSTLMKLIVAFQCNASKVDASNLWYEKVDNDKLIVEKGKVQHCSIEKNKNISKEKLIFISQSKSGLKINKIDLKQNFNNKK